MVTFHRSLTTCPGCRRSSDVILMLLFLSVDEGPLACSQLNLFDLPTNHRCVNGTRPTFYTRLKFFTTNPKRGVYTTSKTPPRPAATADATRRARAPTARTWECRVKTPERYWFLACDRNSRRNNSISADLQQLAGGTGKLGPVRFTSAAVGGSPGRRQGCLQVIFVSKSRVNDDKP